MTGRRSPPGPGPSSRSTPATARLEEELESLLAETNDQRRRVGQAIWHFYRSLLFWRERGRSFLEIARAWAPGGAAVFHSMVATLRRLGPHEVDAPLRAFVAEVLDTCGEDVARGDTMLIPFLRWIEGKFPALTRMMQEESPDSRIYDFELATALEDLFERLAADDAKDRDAFVAHLRRTAAALNGRESS